jgi:dihydrolipoamide dehydrogenase
MVETNRFILATGSRPKAIPGIILDGHRVITSNEALFLQQVPRSLIILGAGAVGVEFANLFHTYGAKVTLVEMLPRALPVEDEEISELLSKSLTKRGIRIMTDTEVKGVALEVEGARVEVSSDGQSVELQAEMVLVAVGRTPNSEGIGAEEVGISIERGFIQVNERMETSVDGIYAIGDVIGPPLLAHSAMAEGVIAVEAIAEMKVHPLDHRSIPSCTYCQPQVASIGLTEAKAREEGYEIKVGRFPFQANGKAQAIAETEGLVKIISDADSGEILGVHILGAEATEMIAALGLARTLEATPEEIAHTIHAHPTLSEAVMEAALAALGQAIHI